MDIRIDNLTSSEVELLLGEHLEQMAKNSPPGSCHALNLEELRQPKITFWSVWDYDELLGCGAIKELNPRHGEIKSMHVATTQRRKGVASVLLGHMLEEAKRRNYERVSLETGSMKFFAPARNLYEKFGFRKCGPFGDYVDDPDSLFMTREL